MYHCSLIILKERTHSRGLVKPLKRVSYPLLIENERDFFFPVPLTGKIVQGYLYGGDRTTVDRAWTPWVILLPVTHSHVQVLQREVPLTLEQHRFELHKSTYTWILSPVINSTT